MKFIKLFESFDKNDEILNYLNQNYTSDWFNQQLSDRVYDYISEDEAEDYDGDYEKAYKNLSSGGAIEYDLLDVIGEDIRSKFNISNSDYYNGVDEIVRKHLIDTCEWYDRYVFNNDKKGFDNISLFNDIEL